MLLWHVSLLQVSVSIDLICHIFSFPIHSLIHNSLVCCCVNWVCNLLNWGWEILWVGLGFWLSNKLVILIYSQAGMARLPPSESQPEHPRPKRKRRARTRPRRPRIVFVDQDEVDVCFILQTFHIFIIIISFIHSSPSLCLCVLAAIFPFIIIFIHVTMNPKPFLFFLVTYSFFIPTMVRWDLLSFLSKLFLTCLMS